MAPRFTSRLGFPTFLLLALAIVVLGCSDEQDRPSGHGGGAGSVSVEAMVVQPQPMEDKILTTGSLLANEEVALKPEVEGRVTGVFFEEGKGVHKGDVLVKINDRELLAELKTKQLEEKLAEDEERRKHSLLDINGISQEDYDKVLNNLNIVEAEIEVIQSQIAETEVRAPFDGIIGLRYISEGSVVDKTTLIANLQNIDPIKVEFAVPEKYSQRISSGTKIVTRVGDSRSQYEGTVFAVESKIDPATRTLKARARIPNPDRRLVPGSFAQVEITLQRIPDALAIPTGAILPVLNGEQVLVCENGLARSVPVRTGIRTDKEIQVVDGLKPGDTLIVTGLLQVSDGKTVTISKMTTE